MDSRSYDMKPLTAHDSSGTGVERWRHAKKFKRGRQLWRLIWVLTVRWVLTIGFCAAVVGVLVAYEEDSGMTRSNKRIFNSLFIAVSLVMSMNVVSSMKAMAQIFRWHILARKPRSIEELDLILSFESFWNVLKLLRRANSWKFRLFCLLWLSIAIAYQAAIALLSINYTLTDAVIFSKEKTRASVTDFSAFYGINIDLSDDAAWYRDARPVEPPALSVQQALAHSFGQEASSIKAKPANLTDRSSKLEMQLTTYRPEYYFEMFDDEDDPLNVTIHYFTHVQNPDRAANDGYEFSPLTLPSDRGVQASYSCESYESTEEDIGSSNNVTLASGDTLTLPSLTKSSRTVIHDPRVDCGTRCSHLVIYDASTESSDAYYYECNITISHVRAARNSNEQIPDEMARLIAASAGLSGVDTDERGLQYQNYPKGSGWATDALGHASVMGYMLITFSALTLLALDQMNPVHFIEDYAPIYGSILKVTWSYIWIILGVIVFSQLLLSVLAVYCGNKAVVLDNSPLPISRLLQTVTEPLGRHGGCMLNGREIARAYRSSQHVTRRHVVYGIKEVQHTHDGPVHMLDISDDIEPRKGRFPEGMYDGPARA